MNFCFVSISGIEKSLFVKWIKEPTANNINDLIQRCAKLLIICKENNDKEIYNKKQKNLHSKQTYG